MPVYQTSTSNASATQNRACTTPGAMPHESDEPTLCVSALGRQAGLPQHGCEIGPSSPRQNCEPTDQSQRVNGTVMQSDGAQDNDARYSAHSNMITVVVGQMGHFPNTKVSKPTAPWHSGAQVLRKALYCQHLPRTQTLRSQLTVLCSDALGGSARHRHIKFGHNSQTRTSARHAALMLYTPLHITSCTLATHPDRHADRCAGTTEHHMACCCPGMGTAACAPRGASVTPLRSVRRKSRSFHAVDARSVSHLLPDVDRSASPPL